MKFLPVLAFFACLLLILNCGFDYSGSVPRLPLIGKPEHVITLDSTEVATETVASGLNVAWEIAWGDDNCIWFTEQEGKVSKLDPSTGEKKVLLVIPEVLRKRSTGLLGMALHPDMRNSPYVFVDYTVEREGAILSKLVRYTIEKDSLTSPKVLLEIPGSTGHNGSRLTIAPDGKLIWATGDAAASANAQDTVSMNGKILRINTDGSVPSDNPIPGSLVWAWGFRNMQGLAYGRNGNLYTSEHGDATDDEVNLIAPKGNYGWPHIQGYNDFPEEKAFRLPSKVVEPLKAWTPTIAPAGIDYYDNPAIPEWRNSILLTTLKDQDLRVLKLDHTGKKIVSESVYLDRNYGRLRDICVSPSGDIFISTSNRDWNPAEGFPKENDDRIIRISKVRTLPKSVKKPVVALKVQRAKPASATKGSVLYNQYCVSCHKNDGNGVPGTFPPLKGAEQVAGSKDALVKIMLHGLSGRVRVKGTVYDQQMPAFGFLNDRDIAEVLTYIRSSWGNKSTAVLVTDVERNRKAK